MRKKIAVVGGSGFVGSDIARSLSDYFDVVILDVMAPSRTVAKSTGFVECDIRDYLAVKRCLSGFHLVINTAIIQIPAISKMRKYAYEVNVIGTQNVCKAVDEIGSIKGMLLAGSWHVIGERGFQGRIDESFGFRPEMVDDRAKQYVLCKMSQEAIMNLYDEISSKVFVVVRLGTVLGENMPKETAANIFISNALDKKPITPFSHSAARPMLYIDILDVGAIFTTLSRMILADSYRQKVGEFRTINAFYPQFVTIMQLAQIVKKSCYKASKGAINPEVRSVTTGQPKRRYFSGDGKPPIELGRLRKLLGVKRLTPPTVAIERIVRERIERSG